MLTPEQARGNPWIGSGYLWVPKNALYAGSENGRVIPCDNYVQILEVGISIGSTDATNFYPAIYSKTSAQSLGDNTTGTLQWSGLNTVVDITAAGSAVYRFKEGELDIAAGAIASNITGLRGVNLSVRTVGVGGSAVTEAITWLRFRPISRV